MEPTDAGTSEIARANIAGVPASESTKEIASKASGGTLVELCETLLITILLALFVTTFVVQPYKIPSDSMEPTLLVGDHVLVNKFVFEANGGWYEKMLPYRSIRRGDIVIFKYAYEDHPDYVKRVIGLPGDRLRIIQDRVIVNGEQLIEPYVVHEGTDAGARGQNFPPLDPYSARTQLLPDWAQTISNYIDGDDLVVPAEHYFVMGDNRDDSEDSRYWGFVGQDAVTGEPMLIYWSVNATEDDYEDGSAIGNIEGVFQTLIHLPSRTRWNRILRRVH